MEALSSAIAPSLALNGTANGGGGGADMTTMADTPISTNHPSTTFHNGTTATKVPLAPSLEDESLSKELPVVTQDLVPLSFIVQRLVAQVHADLLNLTETLPSSSDLARKRAVVDYVLQTRRQLLKLLVLVRWSSEANALNKCMNIIGFLARQNYEFEHSVESLTEVKSMLAGARVRNYDLTTALSVLTSGHCPTLPSSIRESFLAPLPLTDATVLRTLEEVDQILRYRLACVERLPRAMRTYWIRDGRVGFRVDGMWEGTFTYGGQEGQEEWYLLGIRFLFNVQDARGAWSSEPLGPMKETILDLCNRELAWRADPSTPRRSAPLVRAYNFLQRLALSYQIESIAIQAIVLGQTRWSGHLRSSREEEGRGLKVEYWLPKEASTSGPSRPPSIVGTSTAQGAAQQLPSVPGLKFAFGRTTTMIREGDVSGTETKRRRALERLLVGGGTGGKRKADGAIEEGQNGPEAEVEEEEEDVDDSLSITWTVPIDASGTTIDTTAVSLLLDGDLNLGNLLRRVTTYHARSTILQLYDQLVTELDPNDLELVPFTWSHSHNEEEEDDVPSIKVHLYSTHYIIAWISPLSGKLEFKAVGEVSTLREARLRGAADKVDHSRKLFGETLLRVRATTILDEVDSKAAYLGLTTTKRLPLRGADMARFGTTTRGLLFVHLKGVGGGSVGGSGFGSKGASYYLVLVMNEQGFRFALVGTREEADQMSSWTAIEEMGWLESNVGGPSGFDVGIEDLRDLYSYCIRRVTSYLIETQLHLRRIPYQHASPASSASPASPSLSSSAPYLIIHSSDLVQSSTPLAYRNIAIRLHALPSSPSTETIICFLVKFRTPIAAPPPSTSSDELPSTVRYDPRSGVMEFRFDRAEECVEKFLLAYGVVVKSIVMKRHRQVEEERQNALLLTVAIAAKGATIGGGGADSKKDVG